MSQSEAERPSRTRFVLAGWLCGLAGVLYLDRICMSQAVVPIQDELGLSNWDMALVMGAFTIAYGLFEIPTGRLGDRFGSRTVLVRIVVWWSLFTALTGAASGLVMLLAVRFLFGVGEAGAYPNAARVIARWYPLRERGRVQGLMLTTAQAGAFVAPALAAYLIMMVGWRGSFALFGLVGVAWAVGFWIWFRDDPKEHARVNAAELAVIHDTGTPRGGDPGLVPWRAIFTNRGVLILGFIQTCGAFFTYFFYSWFSKYLQAAHHVDPIEAGNLSSFTMFGGVVGVFLGGFVADLITRDAADPVHVRKQLAVGCYLTAAASLYFGMHAEQPVALAAFFFVAFCTMHITLPNWWSCAIPQGGRHIGVVFGLMNGMGVVGALVSQLFVGYFADEQAKRGLTGREQWDPIYWVYIVALLGAAGFWWAYRLTPLRDEIERT